MKLVNLCPHPVVVYPPDAPDTATNGMSVPIRVIDKEETPARIQLAAVLNDPEPLDDVEDAVQIPVYQVLYWPQRIEGLPAPQDNVSYIVSLPVALALPDRRDLLVPYREVRNRTGTVIGCRALSRPTAELFTRAV